MQVKLHHHSPTRKSIDITVPAPEVEAEFNAVVARVAPKVRVPGFRPGKAPRTVLLGRYGAEIHQEVAEALVQRHFLPAAQAAGAQPISQPALEKVDLKEGAEAVFKAHFDVAPEVQLPDYKGLSFTKRKRKIDDEALAEQLEGMRQQAARFVPVEGVLAEDHYATLDIKVKPQGMKARDFKDQVLEVKADRPFDKELLGLAVDATRAFTLTVPEDDPNKAMAGKSVHYEVVLKDLRERQVPELGDEFAKDLGDYENLEALKAFVRKDLEEAAERDAVARLQSTILDTVLDAAPFEVPASMVALQLDDYCQEFAGHIQRQGYDPRKVNWSAYRQTRMRDAERAVRSGYLLQAIGNAEDIQVSDEEIDAELRGIHTEQKIAQPFEAFKAELERRGATMEVKGRIRTEKIFDLIAAASTVTDELLDKAAFQALVELERKREAGAPMARFDAGGLEGGDLEGQEGGDPDAVKAAEEDEAAAKAETETEAEAPAKPKRAPKKKEAAPEAAEAEAETEAPAKPKRAPRKKAE